MSVNLLQHQKLRPRPLKASSDWIGQVRRLRYDTHRNYTHISIRNIKNQTQKHANCMNEKHATNDIQCINYNWFHSLPHHCGNVRVWQENNNPRAVRIPCQRKQRNNKTAAFHTQHNIITLLCVIIVWWWLNQKVISWIAYSNITFRHFICIAL